MFGTDFGEKCIMMQFLGVEKDGKGQKKALNAETQRR
jgi:hypothetical protein